MKKFKFIETAKKLIKVKALMKRLQQKEKELKKKIELYVSPGDPLNLSRGEISCWESKGAESFSRKEVLEFLEKQYGKKVANEVDMYCTKKAPSVRRIHVKIY